MSEELNANATSSEERGFSRRRVVKGVAWSVPVIVTAIAAPAAAASPGKFEALLDYASGQAVTFVQLANPVKGQNRPGKGPIAFHVKNISGAASGEIKGTITITSSDTVNPGVGIKADTFTGGGLTPTALPPANAYSAGFSLTGGVANGATVSFPMGLYYTGTDKNAAKGKQFTLTVSFSSPTGLSDLPTTLTLN
ncbi:hypothetical protein JOE31_001299 [Arthrobacter sp. PvP023]|uniref:hypothetical protein n=1 Tax=Micrococcaceae TaxID=1268 RepID=UPI001AEB6020|nr:hypothetical protein [Arthrobacter sp. PvP023]MBP1135067.1 hypothetical protein [Arthrobacter sp. PvP023]